MDFSKLDGLIPAVVQDASSNEVLMVGFMNQEALDRTRRSGFATFFSRTRGKQWMKGRDVGQHPGGAADSRRLRRRHRAAAGHPQR